MCTRSHAHTCTVRGGEDEAARRGGGAESIRNAIHVYTIHLCRKCMPTCLPYMYAILRLSCGAPCATRGVLTVNHSQRDSRLAWLRGGVGTRSPHDRSVAEDPVILIVAMCVGHHLQSNQWTLRGQPLKNTVREWRIVSYRIIRPGRTTLRTNSGTDYQQQSRAALV